MVAFDVYLVRVNRMWREAERMRLEGLHRERGPRCDEGRAEGCERRERPGDRVERERCRVEADADRCGGSRIESRERALVKVVVLLASGRVRGGLIDAMG